MTSGIPLRQKRKTDRNGCPQWPVTKRSRVVDDSMVSSSRTEPRLWPRRARPVLHSVGADRLCGAARDRAPRRVSSPLGRDGILLLGTSETPVRHPTTRAGRCPTEDLPARSTSSTCCHPHWHPWSPPAYMECCASVLLSERVAVVPGTNYLVEWRSRAGSDPAAERILSFLTGVLSGDSPGT